MEFCWVLFWWNVVLGFYMDSSFSQIYLVRMFSVLLLIIDKPVYCSKTKSSRVFTSERQALKK